MAPLLYFKGIKEIIYTPVPSLEYVAAVKLVIALWNCKNIRVLVNNHRCRVREHNWSEVEEKVKDHLKEFCLSEPLKSKMAHLIYLVGTEISAWKWYHESRFEASKNYAVLMPSQMYWNVLGTIDKKKTAQAWVKDCNIPVDLRYEISCTYCLENEVAKLWKEMPAERKGTSRNQITDWRAKLRELLDALSTDGYRWKGMWSVPGNRWKVLEHCWNLVMEGKEVLKNILAVEDHHLVAEFLVQILCFDYNLSAFYFLFPKLTEGAKSQFLDRVISNICSFNDFHENGRECFFSMLSLLDEEQQRTALLQCDGNGVNRIILNCMEWPRQDSFLQVINCLWPLMPGSNFYSLLTDAAYFGSEDVDKKSFERCITESWRHSPEELKQYVVDYCANCHVLFTMLVKNEDKKNIELIWEYATAEQKENIMDFFEGHSLCSVHYEIDDGYGIKKGDRKRCWQILFRWLIEFSRNERRRKFRQILLG